MKKLTFLVALVMSITSVMSQDFTVSGVSYKIDGAGVLAWGAVSFPGALVIPATVTNGATNYNVTGVRNYFMSKAAAATMTSITVSEGVLTIGVGSEGSFYNAPGEPFGDNITSISLPSTLTNTSFTDFTFMNYPHLTSFTIKCATPPTVNGNTFYNVPMSGLTIHVPAGKAAAYSAAGWNAATIGSGVTILEDVSTAFNQLTSSDIKVKAMSAQSFALSGVKGNATVNVMNLSGKRVAQFNNVTDNQILTNSLLNKGIYIISVTNGVESYNSKLVLN